MPIGSYRRQITVSYSHATRLLRPVDGVNRTCSVWGRQQTEKLSFKRNSDALLVQLYCVFATVGRFSQRTHPRPQGWIPMCPVTFCAFWRQVERRLGVPDEYGRFPTLLHDSGEKSREATFFSCASPMLSSVSKNFKTGKIDQNRFVIKGMFKTQAFSKSPNFKSL